ncbi:MAG: hypothetical protein JSU87_12255 [Gemmatimonadota bacterium]|nr:MAG: hypothetical protein JSU87_12255 [Gemmatimonadota bacterium]
MHDYRSRLNTLVSAGFITDPLAPPRLIIASELATEVAWQRAGGLQVRMLGQRYVTSFAPDIEAGLDFDEPWFVATVPGDSLRLLGGIRVPGRAAVHPFSRGAERYYSFEIGDSVTLLSPARQVELVEIRVTPTRGDEALIVGSVWVDSETGDIAAMQVRFVGKPLWADEDDPEGSEWANRILSVSATVQQGLWETRYWLPHRQELELMVRIPFIGNFAVPLVFRSEFGRYDVNTGETIAWLSPDSLRAPSAKRTGYEGATLTISAGRATRVEADDTTRYRQPFPERGALQVRAGPAENGWEIVRPPDDTLLAYDDWDRPLEAPASELTLPSAAELERRARQLPNDVVGRKLFVLQYDRLPEMIRYNRVESLALGLAGRWDIPRRAFWSLGGAISFGVADLEPKGRLDIRYDAPSARAELAGYSELHVAGSALSDDKRAFGNALRAFFLGRDDADYYRASGAALTVGRRWSWLTGRLALGWEDHRSVDKNTDVALTGIWEDSVFRPNPPANESRFWRGDLAVTAYLGDWARPTNRAELTLGLELGSGTDSLDYVQPRAAFEGRVDFGSVAAMAIKARGGWTGGVSPLQRAWRLGGIETVRGFTHGTLLGDSYWMAQIELSPRRRTITPIVFADFGWAGDTDDWPGDDPLWSLGAGASFFHGVFRADLVFPKLEDVWLELYFAGSL